MKILAVDDSRLVRRLVASAASVMDIECMDACDGVEAMTILNADPEGISLICLDWNMPNMNGLECLQAVRADTKLHHIPVLMLTTEGSQTAVVQAVKAGATAYLSKPFSQQDLQVKIMDCLGLGFE